MTRITLDRARDLSGLPVRLIFKMIQEKRIFSMWLKSTCYVSEGVIPFLRAERLKDNWDVIPAAEAAIS